MARRSDRAKSKGQASVRRVIRRKTKQIKIPFYIVYGMRYTVHS